MSLIFKHRQPSIYDIYRLKIVRHYDMTAQPKKYVEKKIFSNFARLKETWQQRDLIKTCIYSHLAVGVHPAQSRTCFISDNFVSLSRKGPCCDLHTLHILLIGLFKQYNQSKHLIWCRHKCCSYTIAQLVFIQHFHKQELKWPSEQNIAMSAANELDCSKRFKQGREI